MKRTITFLLFFLAATSLMAQSSCGTVKDYDGNTYTTVKIGKQCWMKENLRTKHYADGKSIPYGGSLTSEYSPYYYDYSDSGIPLSERGYLYNWPAAMHGASSSNTNPSRVQGICPDGWHLPSDAEWTQLTDYVSSQSEYVCDGDAENIAKALASTTHWSYSRYSTMTCVPGNKQHYNNSTGFSAVPAGSCGSSFLGTDDDALFWSATQYSSNNAYYRYLFYEDANVYKGDDGNKNDGYSVRCLRD